MNEERKYEILNNLIDAMNAEDDQVVIELLTNTAHEMPDLLPVLETATWLKARLSPKTWDAETMKQSILREVAKSH